MPKEKVRIRKAPKYLPFMILFGAIGFIVALVLNANIDEESRTAQPILGFLIGYLVVLGAIFGLIVVLILDYISRKRAKTVEATRSR